MQRKAPIFSKSLMMSATERASHWVADAIKKANEIANDTDKERRISEQKCPACHYFPRIAGQACTSQPCACCGDDQMYSSTSTDVLCKPCAKEGSLCRHCAGDIDMKTRRWNWPEAKSAIDAAMKEE